MNKEQLQMFLKLAADRLHTTPEALVAAAQQGQLSALPVAPEQPGGELLRRALSDPAAAQKLLSSPAAQKLLEALQKKDGA